jgi:hypothetical protein
VNRIALVGLPAIGIALGAWEAKSCAAIQSGYVAGYSYFTAVFLAKTFCCVGLPLVIYWRTRGVGAGLIAAGVLSCAMFYAGMSVLWRLDRVAWRHESPVKMNLSDKASMVIYLRRGITEKQVEEFRSSVLDNDSGNLPSFVRVYWRLTPDQANGQWGISLYFSDDARPKEVTNYVENVKRDRRVDNVYLDIAPNAIRPQPNRIATPVPSG